MRTLLFIGTLITALALAPAAFAEGMMFAPWMSPSAVGTAATTPTPTPTQTSPPPTLFAPWLTSAIPTVTPTPTPIGSEGTPQAGMTPAPTPTPTPERFPGVTPGIATGAVHSLSLTGDVVSVDEDGMLVVTVVSGTGREKALVGKQVVVDIGNAKITKARKTNLEPSVLTSTDRVSITGKAMPDGTYLAQKVSTVAKPVPKKPVVKKIVPKKPTPPKPTPTPKKR
jgi:hypothetical protein